MKFNREKYIDLLMYILTKTYSHEAFGKTLLCSMMYFIDFNYYELFGELLTNETYIKSKKGIKPEHFKEITTELIDKKQLFLKKESYYNRTMLRYYPTIIPTVKFNSQEEKIINNSITKLYNNNANTIISYARKDPPIIIANLGEKIDCRYVFSRNKNYKINNFI